jgi:hypothetical protein
MFCYIRNEERTNVNAALVDRIFGRGLSAFGTGGGRAAVCGAAASANIEEDGICSEGMVSGGWSGSRGEGELVFEWWLR